MPIPNLDEYNRLKAKTLVELRNTGDGKLFAIVKKKFSAEDGTATDSEVASVYLKEVNEAIQAKQAELAALQAFKVDVLAAKLMGA